MAGQLQVIPAGLLSLLGLKTGGRNPSSLGEQVAPTMDTLRWYLISEAEWVDFGTRVPAAGFNGTTLNGQVPYNEVWYIHDIAHVGDASLAAGDFIRNARCSYLYPGMGSTKPIFGTAQPVSLEGTAGRLTLTDQDRWLLPGTFVGFYTGQFSMVAPGNVQSTGRITRMQT